MGDCWALKQGSALDSQRLHSPRSKNTLVSREEISEAEVNVQKLSLFIRLFLQLLGMALEIIILKNNNKKGWETIEQKGTFLYP